MEWIKFADNPPETDCICVIWNENRPFKYLLAIYSAREKEFMEIEYAKTLEFPLAVTHYIILPPTPHPYEWAKGELKLVKKKKDKC